METREDYRQFLLTDYSRRQSKNPAYSMRAYAKYLGIPSVVLTETIRGNRNLPFKYVETISEKLNLSPLKKELFVSSLLSNKLSVKGYSREGKSQNFQFSSTLISGERELHFNVISEWEHYAVLSLLNVEDFSLSVANICNSLAIKRNRAKIVIKNLETAGLIEKINNVWVRTQKSIATLPNRSSSAHRLAQKQNMELSKEALDNVPISSRYHGSTTMAIDPSKIDVAKQLIRKFQEDLSALLEEDNQKEVYQLCIQLFPLTLMKNNQQGENK